MGLMLAVHNAFSDRSSALLTVQTLISELSSVQSRAKKHQTASSKIFGGDHSRIQKLEELEETIKITEDSKNCAIRQYERIKVAQDQMRLFLLHVMLRYLVSPAVLCLSSCDMHLTSKTHLIRLISKVKLMIEKLFNWSKCSCLITCFLLPLFPCIKMSVP